jgi:hypothetical protein
MIYPPFAFSINLLLLNFKFRQVVAQRDLTELVFFNRQVTPDQCRDYDLP